MNTQISDFGKDKKCNWWKWIFTWIAERGHCMMYYKQLWKLCIDEKDIQGQVYTILTNASNSELIGLYPWLKIHEVVKFFKERTDIDWRLGITEVCCDMSSTMEGILRDLFPNAEIVSDRFHVWKNVLEDIWAIRTRTKTAIKKKFNDLQKAYELALKENKDWEKKWRWRPKKILSIPKLSNGETEIDVITRIGRQIRKRRKDWNENQEKRWEVAKEIVELADLIESYEYIHKLWDIYDETNSYDIWKQKIKQWIIDWSELREKIDEVWNLVKMIENRFDTICNYFISKHSNGFAEWFHSRIQKLISMSRWFINKDYMIYRIIKLCPNGKIIPLVFEK